MVGAQTVLERRSINMIRSLAEFGKNNEIISTPTSPFLTVACCIGEKRSVIHFYYQHQHYNNEKH